MFKNFILFVLFIAVAMMTLLFLLTGGQIYKNPSVQRLVETLDYRDRKCRQSIVSATGCPSGCSPAPAKNPDAALRPAQCHSSLWIATCGTACAPDKGLVRFDDGNFAKSGELIVQLRGPDASEFDAAITATDSEAKPEIGLFRYRVDFQNAGDDMGRLESMRTRFKTIPSVLTVQYVTP